MRTELEPLKKLDEAVQALKAAGYEFSEHKIVNTETFGNQRDFCKRVVEIRGFKYFPAFDNEEVAELGNLTTFSRDLTC